MSLSLQKITGFVGEGAVLLRDLSLEFSPGSFNILLGRTGAGKTELLRILAGLAKISSGTYVLDGRDVTNLRVRSRNVAFVYQEFVNYPTFTLYENIAAPLRVRGLSKDEIDRRVRSVAERLGIEEFLRRRPGEVSGGQQQRLALARALVRDADLILLDEPLANLDYKLRERLRREIRDIFTDKRGIVVFATADPVEALALGGQLFVMEAGRILESGPAIRLYRRPSTRRVAEILSDLPANFFDGRSGEERIQIAIQPGLVVPRPAAVPPGPCVVAIRPHHFRPEGRPGDLEITGSLVLTELSGSETFLHLRNGATNFNARLPGTFNFPMDSTVRLFVSPVDLFYFDTDGQLIVAPVDSRPSGE